MFELTEPLKLIIAFIVGAVIGLEREDSDQTLIDRKKNIYAPLGIRTFSLVALLGCISGLLFAKYALLAIFLSVIVGILLVVYYIFHSYTSKDIGITTEIALLYSYVLGLLIAIELLPITLTLSIAVVLLLMLSRKEQIKGFVADIQKKEINAFISFALIALVILPFLPNEGFSLGDFPNIQRILSNFQWNLDKLLNIEFINPFKLWTIVALITGIDLFGYILERTLGKDKGWLFASVAGGFISSTATTLSLAQESKTTKEVNYLVSAAVFANMASFFQIGIIIAVLSATFFMQSIPTLFLLITSSAIMGSYFYKKQHVGKRQIIKKEVKSEKEIINLAPALKFAGLYLLVQFISRVSLEFFGQNGFLAASAIGAFTGLDAVIVNTAQLAGRQIEISLAIIALIVANAVNLGSKTAYSFLQGNKEFAIKFGISMGIVIVSSIGGLLTVLL